MKNLFDDENCDNSFSKPATYVNQWRYRTVNGQSYNVEFWYNSGSLSGNELMSQFVQVVLRLESIGARVLGVACDAGGSDARLYRLIRVDSNLSEGGWLEAAEVRTPNPWDPSRFIYLFHCSTHDLKSMRNALWTSWWKDGKIISE